MRIGRLAGHTQPTHPWLVIGRLRSVVVAAEPIQRVGSVGSVVVTRGRTGAAAASCAVVVAKLSAKQSGVVMERRGLAEGGRRRTPQYAVERVPDDICGARCCGGGCGGGGGGGGGGGVCLRSAARGMVLNGVRCFVGNGFRAAGAAGGAHACGLLVRWETVEVWLQAVSAHQQPARVLGGQRARDVRSRSCQHATEAVWHGTRVAGDPKGGEAMSRRGAEV
jgi:hypothetical protein